MTKKVPFRLRQALEKPFVQPIRTSLRDSHKRNSISAHLSDDCPSSPTMKPIVKYIIYGGTYDFRPEMKPEMFDEAVRPLVLKLVEVSSASEEEIPGVTALVQASSG